MTKISLEKAFNSYFHDKHTFNNFCNLDITTQYKDIFYSKNTFSPSKELKRYQQFLNFFIFDFMEINENVVFSYRKGVSIYDAVYPHKDSKYILNTDIKSFFLHIDKDDIKSLILKNKKNYLIEEDDIERYLNRLVDLVSYNNILPIGAPTSPKISNAYLFEFDKKLEEYCQKNGIVYTRYSDDFIFSSDTKDKFDVLLNTMKKLLLEFGLEKMQLNEAKTKLQKKGSKIMLLGLVITPNGTITVDKKIKKEIEVILHFYISDKEKFKDFFEKNYDSNLEKVSGRLSHIKSIDKQFISKLKRKYGSYIVNSFIHRDIDE
jgi:RNA-directed DNA polymerase